MNYDAERAIYEEAHAAGMAAGEACTPTPVVFGQAIGLSNEMDTTKPMYLENEGVCGFAWVNVKPGNCRMANFLKQNKLGRPDSYYKGVSVWARGFNQSLERKEAYAEAFAKVLRDAGIKAYAGSRMD